MKSGLHLGVGKGRVMDIEGIQALAAVVAQKLTPIGVVLNESGVVARREMRRRQHVHQTRILFG